uniref:Zinc finger and BTB domain containing 2b n=1 Tax=Scleropages formosus TaxID=113540 RepID=A0A8C9W891_SCLFO
MELANHGLILLQQLNAQREFGFLCDCTVAIGDVFFKAHKAVLAAFSNYFRMLFIHQDSDCVRLKPADIQPDIFSYLLNLMYTGKLAPQLIDPVRLEQGVKFLHAYPLLQEVSLTAFSHAEQGLPLAAAAAAAASLYGIQISDQQSGLSGQLPARSRLPSPFEPEALVDGSAGFGRAKKTRVSSTTCLSVSATPVNARAVVQDIFVPVTLRLLHQHKCRFKPFQRIHFLLSFCTALSLLFNSSVACSFVLNLIVFDINLCNFICNAIFTRNILYC